MISYVASLPRANIAVSQILVNCIINILLNQLLEDAVQDCAIKNTTIIIQFKAGAIVFIDGCDISHSKDCWNDLSPLHFAHHQCQ